MQTSQVKKGTANRRSRKRKDKDEEGHGNFKKPPLDHRIPGWQSAVWDSYAGVWVIRPQLIRR